MLSFILTLAAGYMPNWPGGFQFVPLGGAFFVLNHWRISTAMCYIHSSVEGCSCWTWRDAVTYRLVQWGSSGCGPIKHAELAGTKVAYSGFGFGDADMLTCTQKCVCSCTKTTLKNPWPGFQWSIPNKLQSLNAWPRCAPICRTTLYLCVMQWRCNGIWSKPQGTIATLTTMEVFAQDLYLSVAWIASTQPSLNLRFGHGSRTDALECVQPGCRGLRYSQVPRVIENMLVFICGDWTMQMPTSTRSSAFCIVQDRMGVKFYFPKGI